MLTALIRLTTRRKSLAIGSATISADFLSQHHTCHDPRRGIAHFLRQRSRLYLPCCSPCDKGAEQMTSAIEKHAPSERLLTKTCQNTQNSFVAVSLCDYHKQFQVLLLTLGQRPHPGPIARTRQAKELIESAAPSFVTGNAIKPGASKEFYNARSLHQITTIEPAKLERLIACDLLPDLPPFIGRVCSGYAPDRGVLRTRLV
jgi:hypothetical protein